MQITLAIDIGRILVKVFFLKSRGPQEGADSPDHLHQRVITFNCNLNLLNSNPVSKNWLNIQDGQNVTKQGRYQTLPLGSKSSIFALEVTILQLYIFI